MTDVLPTEFERQRAEFFEDAMSDLYDALPHEYKAELVDGELHLMSPSGERPGTAVANVLVSLKLYQRAGAKGRAYGDNVVRVYRAGRPDVPDVFRRGETADAEPAVPGWRFPVDELFD